MITLQTTPRFSLDSGNPSLDFVNSLDGRRDPDPEEKLPDYPALLRFAEQTNLIDSDISQQLGDLAAQRPHEARVIHAAALVLREAIFRVAMALANGQPSDPDDLHVIERSLATAVSYGALTPTAEGFTWSWDAERKNLERPIWPIAYAAFELLSREDLSRLRVCAADDCDWLFLDQTRNRSRKWCDMSTCGNRAKVARYRNRRE